MAPNPTDVPKQIVDAIGGGVYITDLEGHYTRVNDRFIELTGYDRAELLGEQSSLLVDDATVDRVERATRQLLSTEDQAVKTVEATLTTAAGTRIPAEVTLTLFCQNGEPAGTIGVVREMSDPKAREQELQPASDLHSTVVENIPAGILVEDSTRQILCTNHELCDLFDIERSPDDLLGGTCTATEERITARFVEADQFIDRTNEVVTAHEPVRREEFELVDGRLVERRGTPIRLEDGELGYLWLYHDITERKRAENRFRALFEHMPDPGVIVELTEDDAVTRAVNAAFEDVFGYAAETAVDASLNDLIVPAEFDAECKRIDQQARSGTQLVREVRRQTADGEIRDFLFRNVLIENVEGEPRSHGIYTDITARKKRERRLNELHDATRELMAADTRHEVADIGCRAARDILEFPLNGIHLYEEDVNGLVPLAATSDIRDVIGDPPTFRKGEGIAWEVFESGEPRLCSDTLADPAVYEPETAIRSELYLPLGDQGVFLIGSTNEDAFDEADVSLAKVLAANVEAALDRARREQELRTREQELQRQNDRLEEFASVVSHDLRNPLNVAMGRLELAEKTGNAEHFEATTRAQTRMERIIDDVLTLARQGKAVGETESIALETVARQAWDNVDTGTATLQVDTDRNIDADESRVGQLFENLFRNAVEHSSGEVTVRVGWLEERTGFFIEDTGQGIPPEKRARVFESGYTTVPKGTGFGLAVVQEIAEAHGWEIGVTASTDDGARFEIVTESSDE